jgi:hypothetical protein
MGYIPDIAGAEAALGCHSTNFLEILPELLGAKKLAQ